LLAGTTDELHRLIEALAPLGLPDERFDTTLSSISTRRPEQYSQPRRPRQMGRLFIFVYGVVCYAASLATLLYLIGFLGGFPVPTSLDSPREAPLGTALLIDVALVTLFALQHSTMARPAFKRWWTRIVPEAAERSTYMLFSCLALIALFL